MGIAHKITESQAMLMMIDEDAEYAPFRVINEEGKNVVKNWLGLISRDQQNVNAWFSDAENAANNKSQGESVIVEMRCLATITGHAETLRIEDACFDWVSN